MDKIVQDIGFLRAQSEPVTSVQEARELIAKIEPVLMKLDNGIGLAAIQLGIPKQLAIIKGDQGNIYLINPVVIEKDREFIYGQEGCLSCPGLFKPTVRYEDFIIKNQIIDGEQFREETQYFYYHNSEKNVKYEGYSGGITSIAVQHEIDHFNGKLILDYDVVIEPMRRDSQKIGRNDQCPCGSGRKYKKCCLLKVID
jgi:peptide deformylase